MRLSIITPSLNNAEFISESIESVIYQSGNFELEYIIIDGGSTDNTLKVLNYYLDLLKSKKFKPKCKKLTLKWISEHDLGQSDAINKGVKMSSGEVVNWICSDDLLEAGALQKVIAFFEKNPKAKIVFGKSKTINSLGQIINIPIFREFNRSELIRRWNGVYCAFHLSQPATFLKREVFEEFGGLNIKNHLCMDYELYLKANKKYKFYFLDSFLACERKHTKNKSSVMEKEQYIQSINISKMYWGENLFYFSSSFFFNFVLKKMYYLSSVLKKVFPGYARVLRFFKKKKSNF